MFKKFRLFSNVDRNALYAALLFFGFVVCFESFFFDIGYAGHFRYLLDTGDISYTLISALYIAVSFYCFFSFLVTAFSSARKYKIIYFLFFALAVFSEYGYQRAFARFSDFADFKAAIATNAEQKFSSLLTYSNLLALVPCAVFLVLLWKIKPPQNAQKLKGMLGILLLYAFFFVQLSFVTEIFIEKKFPVVSLNAFCRTSADFLVWGPWLNGDLNVREKVEKPALAENYRPPNNIIFIVDESVRGDHLSLNGYERATTPFLEKLQAQGILHNYGIASSAATSSQPTNNMLVSGLTSGDLSEKSAYKIMKSPSIFEYAKAMNYTTRFFDGQMRDYWFGSPDDKNYIDEYIGANQINPEVNFEKWETDNEIARRINKIISTSTGNFIYVIKRGSHMPYQTNYPAGGETWQPSYNFSNVFEIPPAEKSDEIVNSYDNSLKFNIDAFFENLVGDYADIPNNTVILYTGDHGQTFFKGGKAAHGGETREEAIVPLFIVGDAGKQLDTNYKASHQNLFPTMLDLMQYPEKSRRKNYAPSLLKATAADSQPRFYNPYCGAGFPFD